MIRERKKLDKIGKYYVNDQLNIDKKLLQYRYQTIKKYFKGNNCLEIGTAEGLMTKKLVKDFKYLTIIDGSKKLLSNIKNFKNLKKINILIENYKSNQKFKTIILDHVLEHVRYPKKTLKKIYNLLDDDGVLIVGVPNADSLHRLVAVEMGILKTKYNLNKTDHILGHRRVYTPKNLKNTLISCKFKIKRFEGIFIKPLSNKQIEKNFNEKILKGFYLLGKKFPKMCADICFVCTK